MTASCQTCRFADMAIVHFAPGDQHPEGDQPATVCHRYPPQALAFDGEAAYTWPTVFPGDWCGEYQARPEDLTPPARVPLGPPRL